MLRLNSTYSLLNNFSSTNMNANFTSPNIDLNLYNIGSMSIQFTGSPNGSFFLQGSNDIPAIGTSTLSNYEIISGSVVPINSSGKQTWNFNLPIGFRYLNLQWNFSSGSGTLTSCNVTVRN